MKFTLLAISAFFTTCVDGRKYCLPQETCWPSQEQLEQLAQALEPSLKRQLRYEGKGKPLVSAVPIGSEDNQPLYGLGVESLEPLYVLTEGDTKGTCFVPDVNPFVPPFCLAALRNNPLDNDLPGIVAWPLTTSHVVSLVNFAREFNLCVSIAGTGHDFLNRHSCPGGLFIRTSLMKEKSFDATDTRHPQGGSLTFGPGIVFSEAHVYAADRNRVLSSGWANTVGIIGWSIGGGHGPLAPKLGLGVDNILEAQVVLADGQVVNASATENVDLWRALRGGGGSTWGVITSITVRAHLIPENGFGEATLFFQGTACETDQERLFGLIDAYTPWAMERDSDWAGLVHFNLKRSAEPKYCGVEWNMLVIYVFQGKNLTKAEEELEGFKAFSPLSFQLLVRDKFSERILTQPVEPIIPVPWLPQGKELNSVLVSRETFATEAAKDLKGVFEKCKSTETCNNQQLYHCITGQLGSPQPDDVSISPSFRTAMVHWITGDRENSHLGDAAYFSESAYEMDDYKTVYWGSKVSDLESTKAKYDPENLFGCRHCIGNFSARSFSQVSWPTWSPSSSPSSAPTPSSACVPELSFLLLGFLFSILKC